MRKRLLTLFMLLTVTIGVLPAQPTPQHAEFRFVAGKDALFTPWRGNGENLARLTAFINDHKEAFTTEGVTIHVEGYCASVGDSTQRLQRAKIMSNRVKSELITRCGIREQHFTTHNAASPYGELKNVVVVSITLPAPKAPIATEQPTPTEQPAEQPQASQPAQTVESAPNFSATLSPITDNTTGFNLRTNLLYWAALTPNIGIEWRISRAVGVKVDGAFCDWKYNGQNKIQKGWFVNPEVRYYMLSTKRLYVGLGATLGECNLKLGNTGYQGSAFGGGLTAGYQLPMGKAFMWDFNIGLGAAHFNYDTFGVTDGVRVYKAKGCRKTLFSPTQIGVNLVWQIGRESSKH